MGLRGDWCHVVIPPTAWAACACEVPFNVPETRSVLRDQAYRCDVLQRRLHAGELSTAVSKQANLHGTGRA